jgi:hypothetical protein
MVGMPMTGILCWSDDDPSSRTHRPRNVTAPHNLAIRRALEGAGVEFIDANGGRRVRDNNP